MIDRVLLTLTLVLLSGLLFDRGFGVRYDIDFVSVGIGYICIIVGVLVAIGTIR